MKDTGDGMGVEDSRGEEVRFTEERSSDLRRLMLAEVAKSAPARAGGRGLLGLRTRGGVIVAAIAGLTLAGGAVAIAATGPGLPFLSMTLPVVSESPSASAETPVAAAPEPLPFLPQPQQAVPAPEVPDPEPASPAPTEPPATEVPATEVPQTEAPATPIPTESPVPADPTVPDQGEYPVNQSGQTYGPERAGTPLPVLVEVAGTATDGTSIYGYVTAGDYASKGSGVSVALLAVDGVTRIGSAVL